MRKLNFFVIAIIFAVTSCTLDKTDYEAEINTEVTERLEFKEAISINKENYKVSIESLDGKFFKGYNEIRLKITNSQTNAILTTSEVTFLPIKTTADESNISCPHLYNLKYDTMEAYYSGYSVFTSESKPTDSWKLYLSFKNNNETYTIAQDIIVQEQNNKNLNMTSFTGTDSEDYFIALIAPQKPKIAKNKLVAGIYKYNQPIDTGGNFPDPSQFSYSEVDGYTLLLDPRMPEPSMGNHSSINNENLVQHSDGLYYGIVNYTMTGNWTLNFILQNQSGQTIKGTPVSTDFTPGIEGVKSNLYINILF